MVTLCLLASLRTVQKMKDIQDTIDNYLLGRLSSVEAKELEQEIASDNDVREQFAFTQMVKFEISDRNEKLHSMHQWRRNTLNKQHSNPLRRVLWYSMGGFSAAAMVVFGVFLFQRHQRLTLFPGEVQLSGKSVEKQGTMMPTEEMAPEIIVDQEILLSQVKSDQRQISTSLPPVQQVFAAANVSTSNNDYAHAQYERYMREVEYYQKQAANYRREAEYYKRQAEGYEREQQYHLKLAEKYQRSAADYSKRGDADRAKTQTRYAQNEIDKAKMQASYAKNAWDKYRTQMRYAQEADEKVAIYLRYAREALK